MPRSPTSPCPRSLCASSPFHLLSSKPLLFFFYSFFTQSLLIPQLILYQKRKQKKSYFFSLSVGMVARPNILVNVGFSENVNGTQSQIQLQRERVELSSFFFFARCDFSLCFSQAVPEDGRQEILQVCFSPQRSRCRNKDQNKPPAAAALNYYSHNYFYTETGEQW